MSKFLNIDNLRTIWEQINAYYTKKKDFNEFKSYVYDYLDNLSNQTPNDNPSTNPDINTPTSQKYIEYKTYQELENIRDSKSLNPGQIYCITDYKCTINLPNIQSKGLNGVNIYVKALTNSSFSENATLTFEGHEYDIKYSFTNDTNRFNWATAGGRGVIYYMKDSYGNSSPYDFLNITFNLYQFNNSSGGYMQTFNSNPSNNIIHPIYNGSLMTLPVNVINGSNISINGTGNYILRESKNLEITGSHGVIDIDTGDYILKVKKNTHGEQKIYCLADVIE
jgi:hypothetical protein